MIRILMSFMGGNVQKKYKTENILQYIMQKKKFLFFIL